MRGQGGKGVAAMVGFLLVLSPLSTLTALAAFGLVFLIRHDFNPGITVGIIGLIVLPVLYRQPLWVAALTLVLALLLGGKKWLDSPHEARVWARHPWKGGARPGFQNIEPEDEAAPSSDTQPR
jgi:glycerol-3-phosphate acyltransferase PlsY